MATGGRRKCGRRLTDLETVAGDTIELADGRYRLVELLGSGSFGEVWRGYDLYQDTEVAVKLMDPDADIDEVLSESRLQSRLRDHSHVVTLHNVVLGPPGFFIVMQFLSNGSIEDRLERGEVSLVEAVRWVREALDGLGTSTQQECSIETSNLATCSWTTMIEPSCPTSV
jgi:serine/threonine protein kinase